MDRKRRRIDCDELVGVSVVGLVATELQKLRERDALNFNLGHRQAGRALVLQAVEQALDVTSGGMPASPIRSGERSSRSMVSSP